MVGCEENDMSAQHELIRAALRSDSLDQTVTATADVSMRRSVYQQGKQGAAVLPTQTEEEEKTGDRAGESSFASCSYDTPQFG